MISCKSTTTVEPAWHDRDVEARDRTRRVGANTGATLSTGRLHQHTDRHHHGSHPVRGRCTYGAIKTYQHTKNSAQAAGLIIAGTIIGGTIFSGTIISGNGYYRTSYFTTKTRQTSIIHHSIFCPSNVEISCIISIFRFFWHTNNDTGGR